MSVQSSRFTLIHIKRYGSIGLAGTAAIVAAVGLGYGLRHWQTYDQHRRDWLGVQGLEQLKSFSKCVETGSVITSESPFFTSARLTTQRCQLGMAQQIAAQGKLPEALGIVLSIPEQSAVHTQATQFQQLWTTQVLAQAEQRWQQGQLPEALAALQSLPTAIGQAQKVEVKAQQWQQEWARNVAILKEAEDDLGKGQWGNAKENLDKVSKVTYWQTKSQPLRNRAELGIAAVMNYEREQAALVAARQAAADAAAAALREAAPPQASNNEPSYNAPVPAQQADTESAAYIPPIYSEPSSSGGSAPVAAPAPTGSGFNSRVQSIYEDYTNQGQGSWDAWMQACENAGGRVVDSGPEATCKQ
jgi:hypothetical protein